MFIRQKFTKGSNGKLFEIQFGFLLYAITSTFFEGQAASNGRRTTGKNDDGLSFAAADVFDVGVGQFDLEHYFMSSISPGRQVFSIHGSSGPYMRRMQNQLLSGRVASQLPSLLSGAFGPK